MFLDEGGDKGALFAARKLDIWRHVSSSAEANKPSDLWPKSVRNREGLCRSAASNLNLTESEVKAEELELASFSDVYATFQATSRSHEALLLGTEPLAARAIGWPCLAIARATLWTGSTRGAGFEGSLTSLTERPGV